jgi:SAM-dependent methyltransferase
MSDWETLFGEVYVRTYARLDDGAASEEEALQAVRLAGCAAGADVLDCPCGYGRHALPLARAGYRVVGVDSSEAMLAEAERRAGGAAGLRVVRADYRQLPLPDESFDAALNLFTSLGYWGEKGDRLALAELRRVLRPGGALVVDTANRDRIVSGFRARDWDQFPGGEAILEERRFDPVEGVVEARHTLVEPDGRRQVYGYRLRVYTATELASLLRGAGFGEVAFHGGLDGSPLTERSRLVAVARVV